MIVHNFPVSPVLLPPPILVQYPNIVSYPDINNDIDMRRKIINYFYNIINDSWITYYFSSLFVYLIVENNEIKLIKSLNNLSDIRDNNSLKKNYIFNKYLKKSNIERLINRFRKINDINWWEVKKYQDKFAKYILAKLKYHLESKINNNK